MENKVPPLIYVASSWRNELYPTVVKELVNAGYLVYDFRNPGPAGGFSWDQAGMPTGATETVPVQEYGAALATARAKAGFATDYEAMQAADIFVMVLPCERDAHMEIGWAAGRGKQTHILLDNPVKPSLMYQMVDFLHISLTSLLVTLGDAND